MEILKYLKTVRKNSPCANCPLVHFISGYSNFDTRFIFLLRMNISPKHWFPPPLMISIGPKKSCTCQPLEYMSVHKHNIFTTKSLQWSLVIKWCENFMSRLSRQFKIWSLYFSKHAHNGTKNTLESLIVCVLYGNSPWPTFLEYLFNTIHKKSLHPPVVSTYVHIKEQKTFSCLSSQTFMSVC